MARSAGLVWTDDLGTHTYPLVFPMLDVALKTRRRRWTLESRSGALHVERSVQRTPEIEGTLRFVRDPGTLLRVLSRRVGLPITYYEERDGLTLSYPSVLTAVSPGGDWRVGLDPDPARFSYGEWTAKIALRRVDGGTYETLFGPLAELFFVPDDAGGYSLSTDPTGALVAVDDGGDIAFATTGTQAYRLIDPEPWVGGYEFFETEG